MGFVQRVCRGFGIGAPQHQWRQIVGATALLLSASLFLGCGGSSGMSDAELVAASPAHQAQLLRDDAVDQLKQSGGEVSVKTYSLGEAWAVKLSGGNVTDATFDQLKTLTRIAELDLSKTSITDTQMPRVAEVAGVCFKLDLSQTGITDAGLASLADLPFLMQLNLKGTKVSADGAAKFQAARKANPKVMDLAKKNMKVTL